MKLYQLDKKMFKFSLSLYASHNFRARIMQYYCNSTLLELRV